MTLSRYPLIDFVDPRSRILAALVFSVIVAPLNRPPALLLAWGAAACSAALCSLKLSAIIQRLVPLNVFMLLLLALMPLTVPGEVIATWGPFRYSVEGLQMAARILVKGNAIVLMLVALVGSLHVNTLGHALSHLHVPDKLAHLLLFTVRYLDVLRREYRRLSAAMRLRGFRPAVNRHTYRAYSHLIGMLLVRSLDRSERVVAAMKCRGFRGHFYLLDHFHYSKWDLLFGTLSAAVLAALVIVEWQ